MRLTHATLRNCRLHSELRHEFSPGLNLITGCNETGKSTLVEAMHRGLFLKARGNTEAHRALVPSGGGVPEVELGFESSDRRYVLRKRYGPTGITTLAPHDSVQLTGESAERELEQIVGPSAVGNELKSRWAHLWVWQGQSSNDPTEHATANRDRLLARLQGLGGAAVIQSPSDTRLAARFAEEAGRWFVANGNVRTDSSLGRSLKALETAGNELRVAEERWCRLETSFRDHEAASQAMTLATQALAALEVEEAENADSLRQVDALRAKEPVELAAEQGARAAQERIDNAEKRIAEVAGSIDEHQRAAAPRILRLEETRRNALAARKALAAAESDLQAAESRVRAGRLASELASARLEQLQISGRWERTQAQEARMGALRAEIAAKDAAWAALPRVDASALRELRQRDSAFREAKASLQAMAAELTVIHSDEVPVKVGEAVLPAGNSATITNATEIEIGAVRLRLLPGGGSALDDTRSSVARLGGELRAALDALGLLGLSDAEEAGTRRDGLELELEGLRGRMGELGPEQLVIEAAAIKTGLAEVEARIVRLVPLVETAMASVPGDVEEARRQEVRWKSDLEAMEGVLQEAKQIRDAAADRRNEHDQLERDLGLDNTKQGQLLESLRGQLQLLIGEHGDSTMRARRQEGAQEEFDAILEKRRATREALEMLQPELLATDQLRLQRARQEQSRSLTEARDRGAMAKGVLNADGIADPGTELTVARLRRDRASDSAKNLRLHASAVSLLDDLFQEEQQKLSASFTRPLADRLNGYLRCLFGPRAEAQVDYREGEFQGLRLLRPEYGPSPTVFESLSGGAREQVAAALRFAVAELLAADGDGALPVVFDDAFAYTDPERLPGMIRMLDRATQQGLQVILLTCNSAEYQSLGAKTLVLQRPVIGAFPQNQPILAATADRGDSGSEAPTSGDTHEVGSPAPALATSLPGTTNSEDEDRLLKILAGLGGSSGNQSLREALGWNMDRYGAVKNCLVDNGTLTPGRGRGGSVSLAQR